MFKTCTGYSIARSTTQTFFGSWIFKGRSVGELTLEGTNMAADPTDSFCPQWPDRCCFCLTKRYGVIFTSLFSILSDFFFISCFAYLIYDPLEWNRGKIKRFVFGCLGVPILVSWSFYDVVSFGVRCLLRLFCRNPTCELSNFEFFLRVA